MYAQMIKTDSDRVRSVEEMSEQEREFMARIERGEKSSPRNGCPKPIARL